MRRLSSPASSLPPRARLAVRQAGVACADHRNLGPQHRDRCRTPAKDPRAVRRYRSSARTARRSRLTRCAISSTSRAPAGAGAARSACSNPTARRVEAVVSVDGLDAQSTSEAGDLHKRGYIVPPYGDVRVEGFRTSLDGCRDLPVLIGRRLVRRSARAKARNVGVIAVAIFEEEAPPMPSSRSSTPGPPRGYDWTRTMWTKSRPRRPSRGPRA